ncbi:MAG: YciI family protein [Bacteroidota bacterium]
MKYICLGYIGEKLWEGMSESEKNAFTDQCFSYDDTLRKNGHLMGGEALEGPRNAVTLRSHDGRISVIDGPFAETKEYLGALWCSGRGI